MKIYTSANTTNMSLAHLTTLSHPLVACFSRDIVDLLLSSNSAQQHIYVQKKGPRKRAVYNAKLNGPHGTEAFLSGPTNAIPTQQDAKETILFS